jgi:hypothetical protein
VLIDDIRNHLAVMNAGQRERRTAVLLRQAADYIDSLRQEVRTQRLEIAGLREERRAILGADDPPSPRNDNPSGGWIA